MIIEILIHILISPPGYETKVCYWVMSRVVCNTLSDIFMLFTCLRIYLLIKVFCNLSKWRNDHCKEICNLFDVNNSILFVLICIFKKRPFIFLFTFVLIFAVIISSCIRIFERAYYNTSPVIIKTSTLFQDYENFWNVLWLTAVTITTVGYGDFYCKSHFGRFTSCIAAMLGVFVISLMLMSLE
jgi:hypothetical protein